MKADRWNHEKERSVRAKLDEDIQFSKFKAKNHAPTIENDAKP
jgi:hypothetical protein